MGCERGHNGAALPDGKRSPPRARPPASSAGRDCKSRQAPRPKPRPAPRRSARWETCLPLHRPLGSAAARGTPLPSMLCGTAAHSVRPTPASLRRPPPRRLRCRAAPPRGRPVPLRRPRPGPGRSARACLPPGRGRATAGLASGSRASGAAGAAIAAREGVLRGIGGSVSMATGVNSTGHGGAARSARRVRAGPGRRDGGRAGDTGVTSVLYRGIPAARPFPRGCGASPSLPPARAGRPRAPSARPEPASGPSRGGGKRVSTPSLAGGLNKLCGRLSRTTLGTSGHSVPVARATLPHSGARDVLSDSCGICFAVLLFRVSL